VQQLAAAITFCSPCLAYVHRRFSPNKNLKGKKKKKEIDFQKNKPPPKTK
jgi:hypothetical protein